MATRVVDISSRLKTAKNAQPLATVQGIIYHHTAGDTVEGALQALNQRRLGASYIIDKDGTIYQSFPTGMMPRHMRDPGSEYRTDVEKLTGGLGNANFIGIEVVGANDKAITPAQVAAAQQLTGQLSTQYGFPPQNVWGHGELQSNKQTTEGMTIVNSIRAANPAAPVMVDTAGRDKLAGVMLAEARGEGREGMAGVGNVVLNRASAAGNRFPKTIDEVINNEFAKPLGPNDVSPEEWAEVTNLATQLQNGAIPDNTGGAVYFANTATAGPNAYAQIAASGPVSATIGNHTYHVDAGIGPVVNRAGAGAPQIAQTAIAGLQAPTGGTQTATPPSALQGFQPTIPDAAFGTPGQNAQAAIADVFNLPPPPTAQSFAPTVPETPPQAPPFVPASGPIGPNFGPMLSPADVLNAGPRPRPAASSPVRPPMPNTMDRNLGVLPPSPMLRPGGAPDAGMVPIPRMRPSGPQSPVEAFSAPAGPLDLIPYSTQPRATVAPAIPGLDRSLLAGGNLGTPETQMSLETTFPAPPMAARPMQSMVAGRQEFPGSLPTSGPYFSNADPGPTFTLPSLTPDIRGRQEFPGSLPAASPMQSMVAGRPEFPGSIPPAMGPNFSNADLGPTFTPPPSPVPSSPPISMTDFDERFGPTQPTQATGETLLMPGSQAGVSGVMEEEPPSAAPYVPPYVQPDPVRDPAAIPAATVAEQRPGFLQRILGGDPGGFRSLPGFGGILNPNGFLNNMGTPPAFTPFGAPRMDTGFGGSLRTSGTSPGGTPWQRGTSTAFGGGNKVSGPTQALSWQTSGGQTVTAHTDPWTGTTFHSWS